MAVARKNRPIYVWHHEIHTRVSNEQLVFVLVGFDPVYSRERVLEETKVVLRDLKIGSYSLWELVGEYDLMIRAWLPPGVRANQFVSRLGDVAGVEIETLTITVDSFIKHWMWEDNLDHGEASVNPSDYIYLNEGWVVPMSRISKYQEAGIIHPVPRVRAPEVFIRITSPRKGTSRTIEDQIQGLAKKLLEGNIMTHGVIMKVQGAASYLITGRLPLKNFEAVAETLQGEFAQSGVLETLRCRTITHMSGLYAPLAIAEQLQATATEDASQKPNEQDVERWLEEGESDTLEFKATAFTDLDHRTGKKEERRTKSEQTREIAKATVGLLNAEGGTVVVGIAEFRRFSKESLLRICPDGREVGQYFIVGIDSELPRGGWDKYQRDLASALRNSIDGAIEGWINYHEVRLGSSTLCVIRIRRPSAWFYLKRTYKDGATRMEFYARMGGTTQPLEGREMDQFKEAHPRTTRSE